MLRESHALKDRLQADQAASLKVLEDLGVRNNELEAQLEETRWQLRVTERRGMVSLSLSILKRMLVAEVFYRTRYCLMS